MLSGKPKAEQPTKPNEPVKPAPPPATGTRAYLYNIMQVDQKKAADVQNIAARIKGHLHIYEAITPRTLLKVPAPVIGVIHYRETNLSFLKHLHNGDALTGKTYRVPAGRPPGPLPEGGYRFEDSAVDALDYHADGWNITPGKARWDDMEFVLYFFETYNGMGYRNKGINSPYLWGATQHYQKGLFTEVKNPTTGKWDVKWNPDGVSLQIGSAPIYQALLASA